MITVEIPLVKNKQNKIDVMTWNLKEFVMHEKNAISGQ